MRRSRTDDSGFSEINITPLTDVVLVLLLIFMVATPALVSRSLPVAVPDAEVTARAASRHASRSGSTRPRQAATRSASALTLAPMSSVTRNV